MSVRVEVSASWKVSENSLLRVRTAKVLRRWLISYQPRRILFSGKT